MAAYIGFHQKCDPRVFLPGTGAFVFNELPRLILNTGGPRSPIAAFIIHNSVRLTEGAVAEISVAATHRHWLTRRVMRSVLTLAFQDLGLVCLQVRTASSDSKTHTDLERGGFRRDGQLRRAWDGKCDEVLHSLLPGECRFKRGLNGQKAETA